MAEHKENQLKKTLLLFIYTFISINCIASGNSDIKVNSVGFLPFMHKEASTSQKVTSFSIINAKNNRPVYESKATGPIESKDTGEKIYELDFSALTVNGRYYIQAKGGLKSSEFVIADNVFDDAFKTTVRGMYLWRCGTAVKGNYKGNVYSADICHTDKASLESAGGEGEVDVTGGWHDAGDYGRYVVNAGITCGLMLKAWEQNERNIKRIALDIPVSGAMPEYLEEIKWETDWLLKMQAENGSVYHKVTSKNFTNMCMPQDDRLKMFLAPWGSAATADFVAVLAEAASVMRPYDEGLYMKYIKAAEKSWEFLRANPKDHRPDLKGFKTGEYQTPDSDDRLWASAEMWNATGDEKYLKDFEKRASEYSVKIDTDWDWGNVKNLAMISYLLSPRGGKNPEIADDIKQQVIKTADGICKTAEENAYNRPLGNSYYWGCNGSVARQAFVLNTAYILNKDKKYTDCAADALSHIFGRNYYNRSYVTGIGSRPPMNIHDRRSEADGIRDPWPGYLAGGGQSATDWSDSVSSFTTNEIAINWNASLIYALSLFLYDGPDMTPTATITGTPPTLTPTETPVPEGLIYDGETPGFRAKDGKSSDIMDYKAGGRGKSMRIRFVSDVYEQEKKWELKKPVKPGSMNYIEFEVKFSTPDAVDVYMGLYAGAAFDSMLNINDYMEKTGADKWQTVRLPLDAMLQSSGASVTDIIFRAQTKKAVTVYLDNIRLVVYTPPTPTISPTHTVSPQVTATPSATLTVTSTFTPFCTATPSMTASPTATITMTATVTPTVTPETGKKIIVDNAFNEGSLNLLGAAWFTYNDSDNGGTSKIQPAPGKSFEKCAEGSGKIPCMRGNITTVFQWGYAGMGTLLDKEGKPVDLTGCKGLRFWYKGDGNTYRVKLASVSADFINGEGDNMYGADIQTAGGWEYFDWPLDNLTQEPYWGTKVDRESALSTVKSIQWQTKGQPIEKFEFMADKIEIYGCE